MIIVCAWCEAAGNVTVIDEKEPQKDVVSHGICPEHLNALKARVQLKKALARPLERLAS